MLRLDQRETKADTMVVRPLAIASGSRTIRNSQKSDVGSLSQSRPGDSGWMTGNTEIIGEIPVSQSATCRQLRSSGGATALGRDKNKLRRNSFTVAATRMKQEALKFAIRGIQKGVANVRSPDQRPHE
jgi:hypothetical protein